MAALNIFTDLTAATVAVNGPCYGLHYVDDMEDEAKAAGYPQAYIDMMRAVGGVAVQLYYDAWDNATQALNQSTLLSDMDMLTGYLTPDDETLLPDEWKKLPAWDEGVDSFSPTDDRFVALGVVHGWGQCDDFATNGTNLTWTPNFTQMLEFCVDWGSNHNVTNK
ncbi:MAG: hypothetical protein MMC23_001885 [Stictis urceolatum]|nr:hypothetical protein [Stictis urceolata]